MQANFAAAADDILIADFESDTYGEWKITGDAFGDGPAEGTLPGQMHVSGFQGKRLVNSFVGGDKSTGTLTSPAFSIDRPLIKFLIGGGGHQGRTCMQLMIDNEVVREAAGTNTQSGGSESLEPAYWDVSEFVGKQARIAIIDQMQGGWGHVNVDHIVQSDQKPATHAMERDFVVQKDYLLIPIRNGAPKVQLEVAVDGKPVRRYSTELATSPEDVDWYAYFNLSDYRGKSASVSVTRAIQATFDLIRQSDSIPAANANYDEPLRPQFHFSQLVGWNNDPNGMVYLDGEWHLYFQHNPVGWSWGNMTWGHAVSKDLVHWEQLPNVLFPGTTAQGACFSGGAVIDRKNTAGWKTGQHDVLVAFLTDTGAGEAVAYSNDRGRSFTWYEGNPVIKHKGRDPKVIWYSYGADDQPISDYAKQLGGHWVMVLYDESEKHGRNIAFYTSTDLKDWTLQSNLTGYYECPELFELPVDGDPNETRWVTFAADGKYAIGGFDGKTFSPHHEGKHQLFYGNVYASQTFDSAPDDRRILIGWMRVAMKGMPFNQAFTFPNDLTLRTTGDGVRMFSAPVHEIETIRAKSHSLANQTLASGRTAGLPAAGQLFDVQATFEIGGATAVGLDIGGNRVVYDVAAQKWQDAPAKAKDGKVNVRVLVDRSQIEVWGNDGAVMICEERKQQGEVDRVTAFANGGDAKLLSLKVHELKSTWPR